MNSIIQNVLENVRQNKLLEACELLGNSFPTDAAMISAQIHELNQAFRREIIDFKEYKIEANKIRLSILDLVRNYKEDSHKDYKNLVKSSQEIFELNNLAHSHLIEEANQIIDDFDYWRKAGLFLFELRYKQGSEDPIFDREIVEQVCNKWPARCLGQQEEYLNFTTEFLEFIQDRLSTCEDIEGHVYEKIRNQISPANRDMANQFIIRIIEEVTKVGPDKLSTSVQETLTNILEYFKSYDER